jgi:hypothetical protein
MDKPQHANGVNRGLLTLDKDKYILSHADKKRNSPIPIEVIRILENKINDITHGTVKLKIIVHDNHCRFEIGEKISYVPDVPMSGSVHFTAKKCVGDLEITSNCNAQSAEMRKGGEK